VSWGKGGGRLFASVGVSVCVYICMCAHVYMCFCVCAWLLAWACFEP